MIVRRRDSRIAGARRRTAATVLVLLASAVAGVTACGAGRTAGPPGTTDTSAPATTVPVRSTTTVAPPASTAVWPPAGAPAHYATPQAAAQAFVSGYIGFVDPIIGPFRRGDSRSGGVDVRPTASGPATVVLVRQLSADGSLVGPGRDNREHPARQARVVRRSLLAGHLPRVQHRVRRNRPTRDPPRRLDPALGSRLRHRGCEPRTAGVQRKPDLLPAGRERRGAVALHGVDGEWSRLGGGGAACPLRPIVDHPGRRPDRNRRLRVGDRMPERDDRVRSTTTAARCRAPNPATPIRPAPGP